MRNYRTLWNLLLFLFIVNGSSAQELAGSYVLDAYGMKETVTLSPSSVATLISGEGMQDYSEDSPVAYWSDKIIVMGPRQDRMAPYEVLQILHSDSDGVMLGRSGKQFQTVEEAQTEESVPGKFYLRQARYEEALQLPILPEPDLKGFCALLEEALQRADGRKLQGGEEDALFVKLLLDKALNPFASKDVFIVARQKYAYEPQAKELLDKLQALSEE